MQNNIKLCLRSIVNTRNLILEHEKIFDQTVSKMGDNANEIIRKNFSQGRNCLESYLAIISLIEQLIESLDFNTVSNKLNNIQKISTEYEKRFYFLENRVKMVTEIVMRRLKTLEK